MDMVGAPAGVKSLDRARAHLNEAAEQLLMVKREMRGNPTMHTMMLDAALGLAWGIIGMCETMDAPAETFEVPDTSERHVRERVVTNG